MYTGVTHTVTFRRIRVEVCMCACVCTWYENTKKIECEKLENGKNKDWEMGVGGWGGAKERKRNEFQI